MSQGTGGVPQLARSSVPSGRDRRSAMVPVRAVELHGARATVAPQPSAPARQAARRRAPRGPALASS